MKTMIKLMKVKLPIKRTRQKEAVKNLMNWLIWGYPTYLKRKSLNK